MALGIALMFGVVLPVNFFSPFKAKNISEFWSCWHITLSNFVRNYIYYPLSLRLNRICINNNFIFFDIFEINIFLCEFVSDKEEDVGFHKAFLGWQLALRFSDPRLVQIANLLKAVYPTLACRVVARGGLACRGAHHVV